MDPAIDGSNRVDKGDLLKALVGGHIYIKLLPIAEPLVGCRGRDAAEKAKVGPEVLDQELLLVEVHTKLLSTVAGHGSGDVVHILGEQADGVLVQPFHPKPHKVWTEGELGVVAPLGLGL